MFSASLTRRAVASAFIMSLAAVGGVASGHTYQEKQKPRYLFGNATGLFCTALQTLVVICLRFIFMYINRQRSKMNLAEIKKQIEHYGGDEFAGDHHPEYRYAL